MVPSLNVALVVGPVTFRMKAGVKLGVGREVRFYVAIEMRWNTVLITLG